jgi:hypothetical protein
LYPTRQHYEFASLAEFFDHAEKSRWTDGLPVVPPTPELVDAMVAASGRPRHESFGLMPPRYGEATVEVIAVNAVMAGCRPEYMPLVVTAVQALLDPAFDLYAIQATTHPCGVLVLVSGPLATALGINGKGGCFGPGFRANATIGRAIRLVLINVGGAIPQITDMATQGSPAKFSFCFTENVAASPWEPYHVSLGYGSELTTVTVSAAEAPHNINDHGSDDPAGLMFTMAQTIATLGKSNAYVHNSEFFVVLSVEHAGVLSRAGWSRRDVQKYLYERARIPYRVWRRGGNFRLALKDKVMEAADDDMKVPMTARPDNIGVLVAGGGGRHSSWIPTTGQTRSVTRAVETVP